MKPALTLVAHVDWRHVRQRPHHFASALSADYDVTVVAPVSRKVGQRVRNPHSGVRLARVWRLPGSYRSGSITRVNASLARAQCAKHIESAEVVVVTSPELWPWVERTLGRRALVYDCMDDALAFEQNESVREAKRLWERMLLARADVVACASDELRRRCVERGAHANRLVVIPNGWDPQAFPLTPAAALPSSGPFELAYFGTIGAWLDDDALRAALARAPDATIRLIGPNERTDLSGIERIALEPPRPHVTLASAVGSAHALLMPFRIDALTRAVDPVKLYEYIALGKPILASYWPALERFARFVTFYRSVDEFASLVEARRIATPPPVEERRAFLEPQTWAARARELRKAIARALSERRG